MKNLLTLMLSNFLIGVSLVGTVAVLLLWQAGTIDAWASDDSGRLPTMEMEVPTGPAEPFPVPDGGGDPEQGQPPADGSLPHDGDEAGEVAVTEQERFEDAVVGCDIETYVWPAAHDDMVTVGAEVTCDDGSLADTDHAVDYCALYNSSGTRLVGMYGMELLAADVPLTDGNFSLRCDRKTEDADGEEVVYAVATLHFEVHTDGDLGQSSVTPA